MSSLYVNTIYPISGDTVTLDGDFTVTGDFIVTGSQVYENGLSISGSFRGGVSALSVVSNTASLNCSTNNFFTLQLIPSANVHISASNIQPGQTINVLVSTTGSGTVSLSSNIDSIDSISFCKSINKISNTKWFLSQILFLFLCILQESL